LICFFPSFFCFSTPFEFRADEELDPTTRKKKHSQGIALNEGTVTRQ